MFLSHCDSIDRRNNTYFPVKIHPVEAVHRHKVKQRANELCSVFGGTSHVTKSHPRVGDIGLIIKGPSANGNPRLEARFRSFQFGESIVQPASVCIHVGNLKGGWMKESEGKVQMREAG